MTNVQTERTNQITEGVIWKQLLIFFFPIFLGTLFQQLYNTVDVIVVGNLVGKEALAAVGGATSTLINLMIGFFVGLSSGATVIISQFFGARKDREVGMAVHTAAAMALTFGALLTAAGLLFAPTFLQWMDTPADVLPYAAAYLRIYFIGMIPSLIYNIGSGVLRAVGDSRRPLYFLMASCMTNIVLDLVFVAWLRLGVQGVALATILSQTVSASLVIFTLRRTRDSYRLYPSRIRFHVELLGRIIRIGLPAGLQSVMYASTNVMIQTAINSFGTDVIAGWTAYGKVDLLFWSIVNAFSISITTFVGQNFGARRYDRIHKSVRQCLAMTIFTTLSISAVLWGFGESLYHLFTNEEAVIEQGMYMLRLLVPTYITYICLDILSGAVRGAGDTLIPTLMTLVGVCMLRVLWLTFFVPTHNTLFYVLISYPITWLITSIAFIVYYLQGGWLRRCTRKAGFTV